MWSRVTLASARFFKIFFLSWLLYDEIFKVANEKKKKNAIINLKKKNWREWVARQTPRIERSNRQHTQRDILNHSPFTRGRTNNTSNTTFIPPGHMLMRVALFRYSSLVRLTCRLLVIAFKRGKNRLNIWALRARAHISVTDGLLSWGTDK